MSNLHSRTRGATQPARRHSKLAALAAAFLAIAVPTSASHAAPHAEPVTRIELNAGRLFIAWSGIIKSGMADFVAMAVRQHDDEVGEVILVLNSPGGSVAEGDRVVRLLHEVKRKHRVTTAVFSGSTCASMCVPIFLAGQRRAASRASLWLFHEVTEETPNGDRTSPEMTKRLFDTYFVPAGVSAEWIGRIMPNIKNTDIWRTGSELVAEKTGIITEALPEQERRSGLVADASQSDAGKRVER